ncbi:hypothetical protein AWU17_15060 [Enterococcus faecium]|nr:hypothetical protein AWU17_15060 [Enterococcus faecium]
MDSRVLKEYLDKNDFPIIRKGYHKYLTFEGMEDSHTYILKEGTVKASVISNDGRKFNRIRQKSPILYRWVMNAVRYEGYRW